MLSTPTCVTHVSVDSGSSCAHGLALPPHLCHHTGMDTSTTPHISPALEPESMNDIRVFEGEEEASRINVALRQLLNRVKAELAD